MSILFTVVIYGIAPDDSSTLTTLLACLKASSRTGDRVLVLDNSPAAATQRPQDPQVDYRWLEGSRSLAHAYNIALAECLSTGADWLVTLDQDSIVSADYVEQMHRATDTAPDVAAIFPVVRTSGRTISPFGYNAIGLPEYHPFTKSGKPASHAINSFTAFSVPRLQAIGGFDEYYWLDSLDMSTFHRLARAGGRFQTLDVTVDHGLSLLTGEMSAWRFLNIARYETAFTYEYLRIPQIPLANLRLISRILKAGRYSLSVGTQFAAAREMCAGLASGLKRRWFGAT